MRAPFKCGCAIIDFAQQIQLLVHAAFKYARR
jgi:hypothetical protein